MFFINAEALGDSFFTSEEEPLPEEVIGVGRNNGKPTSKRTQLFATWIFNTVIPIYNQANPLRTLNPDHAAIRGKRKLSEDNRLFHKDGSGHKNSTFITLAVAADTGTYFTQDDRYEYAGTNEVSKKVLKEAFKTPPLGHAAVFDPDLILHAAPPALGSIVFRADFYYPYSFISPQSRKSIAINCPDSELCIDPFRV